MIKNTLTSGWLYSPYIWENQKPWIVFDTYPSCCGQVKRHTQIFPTIAWEGLKRCLVLIEVQLVYSRLCLWWDLSWIGYSFVNCSRDWMIPWVKNLFIMSVKLSIYFYCRLKNLADIFKHFRVKDSNLHNLQVQSFKLWLPAYKPWES